MILYCWALAPYSKKAMVVAYERGVEFERVEVPPYDKERMAALRNDEHPLATIPLLRGDDGEHLTDSSIIAEFFDLIGTAGERMIPAAPEDALRVRAIDRLADQLFEPIVYLTWAFRKAGRTDDRVRAAQEKVERVLGIVEKRLEGSSYLAGNRYSLADISIASAIAAGLQDGTVALAPHPTLLRWYEELQQRPSWQRLREDASKLPMPF